MGLKVVEMSYVLICLAKLLVCHCVENMNKLYLRVVFSWLVFNSFELVLTSPF